MIDSSHIFVVSLENPSQKEKEIRICSSYKFALLLLEARKKQNPEFAAEMAYELSKLNLQPKHRLICLRMAIKSNLQIKNFGYAAELLEVLLPLNLVNHTSILWHHVC